MDSFARFERITVHTITKIQTHLYPTQNIHTYYGRKRTAVKHCKFVLTLSSPFTYLLIYLLTYSMVHSPSWEANLFAPRQEILRILCNPKVHYRTHKRPPPVPILGQPNPVHIPTSHLLEIRPNIIHPPMPRSPQWSLSLRFPHQDPIRPPLLTHTCHMPSPSHSSRFYHPHNIFHCHISSWALVCLILWFMPCILFTRHKNVLRFHNIYLQTKLLTNSQYSLYLYGGDNTKVPQETSSKKVSAGTTGGMLGDGGGVTFNPYHTNVENRVSS